MSDLIERAKKFQDHLRDTNSQEAEELVGELIAEVERLQEKVQFEQDLCIEVNEKAIEQIESLTKELEIANGLKGGTYRSPENGWTCYHCGITFRTPGGAQDHFGARPKSMPKCKYHDSDVEKLEAQLTESQEKVKELKELESKICPGCHGKGFYKSDPAFSQTTTKFQCKVCDGKGVR